MVVNEIAIISEILVKYKSIIKFSLFEIRYDSSAILTETKVWILFNKTCFMLKIYDV